MTEILEKISSELASYYDERSELGEASQKVGWKHQTAQNIRFEQLAKIINPGQSEFTINDIGCGLGDLFSYLKLAGHKNFKYHGFDIMGEMISQASERHATHPECTFTQIEKTSEVSLGDYSVASGIFNLSFGLSLSEWQKYLWETLEIMDKRSARGFAFNCLTSYSDPEYKRDELSYTNPCLVFDYCKRNFSRNVALLHDYNEYDFTILVRKNAE